MKFRWSIAPPQPLLAGRLADALNVSPLLAQCLLNRGLSETGEIRDFLQPRLRGLRDPFLLPQMRPAVERLFAAREKQERLVIFGDYDVDGVTSTALLMEALTRLGWRVDCHLPHRFDEGYGLSREGIENCLAKFPASLMLAVDCGSTAADNITWLQQRGVDVIVLDHHQVSSPPPPALALVNPHLSDPMSAPAGARTGEAHGGSSLESPPSTELCSAGLAFKLAHALVKHGRQLGLAEFHQFDLRPLLDLVALGTIADIVPLVGENRILVSAGLERLNATGRPGLVALKQVAQCPEKLGPYEVGFQLAPRLNAAGRLETASDALRLLMADGPEEALRLARDLDARNRERQKIERGICDELIGALRARHDPVKDLVIVEGGLLWHIGVIGIVASRVLQEFYRPTIIIGGDGAHWRGSGRSISGFDLAAALRECDDLLVRHGGHAMAAGLSIDAKNVDALRERLNGLARQKLKPDDLQPSLRLDSEVGLDEITFESLAEMDRLQPIGQKNPAPQFWARSLSHQRPLQRIGAERKHVKMWVTDGAVAHEAIWWGAGNGSLPVGKFDLAFAPQINHFNGSRTIQLKVLDWRPTEPSRPLQLI